MPALGLAQVQPVSVHPHPASRHRRQLVRKQTLPFVGNDTQPQLVLVLALALAPAAVARHNQDQPSINFKASTEVFFLLRVASVVSFFLMLWSHFRIFFLSLSDFTSYWDEALSL